MNMMKMKRCVAGIVFCWVASTLTSFSELYVTIAPDSPSGVYAAGETASWTVNVNPDPASPVPELTYKINGTTVSDGKLNFSGTPMKISASRTDPGFMAVRVFATGNPDRLVALGGAIFSPEKILPAAPEPTDFDAFWQSKLDELVRVPINPVVKKIPDLKNAPGVDYYQVTLDNIRGTHVHGQLAHPSAEGKYPAMLKVMGAGVSSLQPGAVLVEAKAGWLVFQISAHDLPIDETPEFYTQLKNGALKNYPLIGSEDRETSYFLRMFLGCARAVDYLTSRPDWNGKVLLVTGMSQGGLQSFATAGLCPKVTGVMALVPAGCDVYSMRCNRAPSWPYWFSKPGAEHIKKVETTAGYFDGRNFAARIHCPALVGYGLIDETSRPTSVATAVNALKGTKETLILPLSNHMGRDHTGKGESVHHALFYSRAEAWKKAALAGQSLPPKSP
jgi:cephalosporin-C deacetylase